MIDAYFDGELNAGEKRFVDEAVRQDSLFGDEFARTESMLDDLRKPAGVPDLSASILAEVDRRRGWISSPLRNLVSAGRLAAAACFLVVLAGLYVTERVAPGTLQLSPEEAPLTEVVQASSRQVETHVAGLADVITEMQDRCDTPVFDCQLTRKRFDLEAARMSLEGTVTMVQRKLKDGAIVVESLHRKLPAKVMIEAEADGERGASILLRIETATAFSAAARCNESMTPPPIVQDED